jgi:hypothetical protein
MLQRLCAPRALAAAATAAARPRWAPAAAAGYATEAPAAPGAARARGAARGGAPAEAPSRARPPPPPPAAATRACPRRPPPPRSCTVYVIFGAAGGVGSALAKRLAAQPGATVVLAGRDGARLDALRAELGGAAVPIVADPLDSKQVRLCGLVGAWQGAAGQGCLGEAALPR